MSLPPQADLGNSETNTSVHAIEDPISGITRADTLPDIADDHAHSLSKLSVSDGDFHTKATVNGQLFSR